MSIWATRATFGALAYEAGWTGHFPDPDTDPQSAVTVAGIPAWCVQDGQRGRWLRLSISSPYAAVVMDQRAVRRLHEQLGEWLAEP